MRSSTEGGLDRVAVNSGGMSRRSAALLLTLALCPLSASGAAPESWVALGPPGGDVRSLAADPRDPRVLYLGTADGVLYRSDDAGGRWQRLEPGFPQRGMSLDDLVMGPDGQPLRRLLGGERPGRRGGPERRRRPPLHGARPEGQGVRALAMAPSDPRVLVAGTLGGVLRSEDAGGTWRRISPEGHVGDPQRELGRHRPPRQPRALHRDLAPALEDDRRRSVLASREDRDDRRLRRHDPEPRPARPRRRLRHRLQRHLPFAERGRSLVADPRHPLEQPAHPGLRPGSGPARAPLRGHHRGALGQRRQLGHLAAAHAEGAGGQRGPAPAGRGGARGQRRRGSAEEHRPRQDLHRFERRLLRALRLPGGGRFRLGPPLRRDPPRPSARRRLHGPPTRRSLGRPRHRARGTRGAVARRGGSRRRRGGPGGNRRRPLPLCRALRLLAAARRPWCEASRRIRE